MAAPYCRPDDVNKRRTIYIDINGRDRQSTGIRIAAGKNESSKEYKEAMKEALKLQSRLESEANHPKQIAAGNKHSWRDLVQGWEEERAGRDLIADRQKFVWLEPHLGDITDVNLITRQLMHKILLKREGVSVTEKTPENNTANHISGLVKTMLNTARSCWEGWENTTLPKFMRYEIPDPKVEKYLTVEQWLQLKPFLPLGLQRTAEFSIATGLRQEKVFGLRWSDISIKLRTLKHSGKRNKLANLIPLNDTAMRVLIAILEECNYKPTSEHVFLFAGGPRNRRTGPTRNKVHDRRAWQKAFEAAGLEYVYYHGLRRSFNMILEMNGVPSLKMSRLCGHKVKGVNSSTYLDPRYIDGLRVFSHVVDIALERGTSAPPLENYTNLPDAHQSGWVYQENQEAA